MTTDKYEKLRKGLLTESMSGLEPEPISTVTLDVDTLRVLRRLIMSDLEKDKKRFAEGLGYSQEEVDCVNEDTVFFIECEVEPEIFKDNPVRWVNFVRSCSVIRNGEADKIGVSYD